MGIDDIVIGSGLAALGAVLGLSAERDRRILVLTGPPDGAHLHFDERRVAPCARLGPGGLGCDWHGVIPLGLRPLFKASTPEAFKTFFEGFYPHAALAGRLGGDWVFVPWRPIRPYPRLMDLSVRSEGQLSLVPETAVDVRCVDGGVEVHTAQRTHRARRVWLAAGAMRTPPLLARSLAPRAVRDRASDHVFCYLGQLQPERAPAVARSRDGILLPVHVDAAQTALYSTRPAAFDFRRLDHGIELRALFGLPTGSAVAKIARRSSLGLLVEAFYNRFGLFGSVGLHSAYAQLLVSDAYRYSAGSRPLQADLPAIQTAMDRARRHQPFANLTPSRQQQAYVPGIHLHHTVEPAALRAAGIDDPDSPVQVVDASTLVDIGPEHHSFKMMLSAYERACLSGSLGPARLPMDRVATLTS
ncbi:MAG: hypothetical protein ACKVQR_17055 [Aquabacterium sp.]